MSAVISECGTYRYLLERRNNFPYANGATSPFASGICVFIMLNPSTADASLDDPTIRRCVDFSCRWNHKEMWVVNLMAARATDPRLLNGFADPFGPRNDEYISMACNHTFTRTVVAAWGANAREIPKHVASVCALVKKPLMCLGVTKDGHPRHPLYVKADTQLVPWTPPHG